MPYSFYKVMHFIGIFMVIASLGAATIHMANGGTKAHKSKKLLGITHGIGLLLSFVAGMGLLARLGMATGIPGWAFAKMAIWLVFGGMTALIYRQPQKSTLWWALIFIISGAAAYLAQYKPF